MPVTAIPLPAGSNELSYALRILKRARVSMGRKRKIEKTVDAGRGAFATSELRKLSSDPAITRTP